MRSLLRFHTTGALRRSSTELRDVALGRRIDPDALAASLCDDAPIDPERTLFEGVESELLPDAFGAAPAEEPPITDMRRALDRVREAVLDAVEDAIGDAHVVGVNASGGVDSSIVLACASDVMRRRGGKVVALPIAFGGPGDDRPHLRAMQEALGVDVIAVSPGDGASFLHALADGLDGAPMLWPFAPTQLASLRAAEELGIERVLTGVGGDEFFDGRPQALGDCLREAPRETIARARSLRDFAAPRHPVFEYLVRPRLVRLLPRSVRRARALLGRRTHATSPWAGARLRRVTRALTQRSVDEVLAPGPSDYFALPMQRFFAWLVHQEQRAGIAVERYDPLLTRPVKAVVDAIAPPLLLGDGRRRGLLRDAMRGKVPDSVLARPDKADFAPAFRAFFAAAGGAARFREELEGRMLARLELVDPATFRREATRALEDPERAPYGLAWNAVAAEAFLLRHPELV